MSEKTNIATLDYLNEYDPAIGNAMTDELKRQRRNLELIASENIVSPAVMAAMGSHLTNKYAEGYPGKRYYGGCVYVDKAETLAIERAKQLFGAEHANVQPHCGANANIAVYYAFLKPGDTILGMNLAHGGHLSHGSPVNISGKYFNIVPYGVDDETHTIDYDKMLEIARECGISGAAIHQRIRKLDDSGVILGSRLIVDPKMMGFDVCAHISITLKDPQLLKQTVEQLKEIPEIVEAHFITGSGNILVKLYCVDNEHLMRTIFDGILRIQGVASTETQISLQEAFQRQVNIDFIEE